MHAQSQDSRELAKRVLSLLDLTSLGEDDSPADIEALCAAALASPDLPAALCVYPEHVTTVRRALAGTPIRVATVVNFPDGGDDGQRIDREIRRATAAGAGEIDLVFPYRAFARGELAVVQQALAAGREACGAGITLKLILETGALDDPAQIRRASHLGIGAGVDFLKTSTGKADVGATPIAAAVILDAIAETGGRCGFKAAGGIRSLAGAAAYLELAQARLGADWIEPGHFRIGASSLFTEIRAMLAEPA